ncbi:MAG: glycosyltransferase family 2 protein [bacterium]
MPEVSVVIATYNRQRLVQETIDSVLRQTFANLELIVVDDGSTDDTGRILLDRYGSRIRYIYQENQGESAARNRGLEFATGEYIAFLDSDDLWHRNKLQRQIEAFKGLPDTGLVSTQAYLMSYEGLRLEQTPQGYGRETDVILWADLVLDNVVAGGGSSALVRRTCLDHVGWFDTRIRFGEEWDLWLRIARRYEVRQIPEPLVYYRLHRFGTRSWAPRADEAEDMYREHIAILEKAFRDCPYESSRCKALRGQALSRIYLRRAIVDLILGNNESGHGHWLTAIRHCPQYAADRSTASKHVVHFVTGYASIANDGLQIAEANRLLTRILSNLPSQVSSLTTMRNALRARCLAEMAFLAAASGDAVFARRAAYRCLASDFSWRRNRGLLKILITGGRHLWPKPLVLGAYLI